MKRLLCLGDSNTFGYDPRSCFGSRYPADVRWTGLLERMGLEVVNLGQNGLSIPTRQQLPAVAETLCRIGPVDAVTVMLGSNDLLGGAGAQETAERMEHLLRCIAEHVRGARIVLIAPPPMQRGDWVREQELLDASVRLGVLYRDLANRLGVAFADAGEWGAALAFDGVHLLPEGHAAFAAGLAAVLLAAEK